MKRNRCEGCKVLVKEPLGCRLGYPIRAEKYSTGRVEYYSIAACPRPVNYHHAKQLLAERENAGK